jgi:hypothetical protein
MADMTGIELWNIILSTTFKSAWIVTLMALTASAVSSNTFR